MKSLRETTSASRKVSGQHTRRSRLQRVGRIIVVLWIVGFIAFLVIVKLLQESSFGPLQRAAQNGDLPAVKSLIEQGTPVDHPCDFNRWTALHAAAHKGNVEIAEYLLKQGANVDVKDKDGYTPLHNTADSFLKGFPRKRTEADRNRIAALLLKYGAHVNATINHGDTPLHRAAITNNVALVQLLLENGADPNIQQSQGMTPLHFALGAGKDRVQVVHLLLAHGADSSSTDEYGRTATDNAKLYHPKLLELLGE
ncbi:MAG: ankyrin repeat domain-containing protein [Phycisphaerae bacterium]|nr:ankyrin repeat domain-containing protein [Phycisphaerae bacterium]